VFALKIGMPRIRFTRKVVIISLGMLALLGGSGAAALYVGADKLMGERQVSATGGECNTVQTMVLKTPAKRLWMRKYITLENADGPTRIRTALRIAGMLAKNNAVDLVQVNVLDAHGPAKRAEMRGRAIGAEVVIALAPKYLPDMKQPFTASYYEGFASAEGRFYGKHVALDIPAIQKLMVAMKSGVELEPCIEPERPEEAAAGGNEHGKSSETVVSGEHSKPAAEGEHAATGDEAAAEGNGAPRAKEQSFLDSVLSMIGLGGSEAPAPEGQEAKVEDSSHAVADEAIEPAAEGHGEATKAEDADKHAEAEAAPTSHETQQVEQDAH
jgi:hypothetical protein